jgi:hypothetical protein
MTQTCVFIDLIKENLQIISKLSIDEPCSIIKTAKARAWFFTNEMISLNKML